jgi:hypothetical protein
MIIRVLRYDEYTKIYGERQEKSIKRARPLSPAKKT